MGYGRRLDVLGLGPKGELWAVEVKSSVEDFRVDQKWQSYLDYCDRFFFAVPMSFPKDLVPDDVGLIVADRFEAAIIRASAEKKAFRSASKKASDLLRADRCWPIKQVFLKGKCIGVGSQKDSFLSLFQIDECK